MWSINEGICLLFLIIIAVRDIQTREISVATLALGLIFSTGYQIVTGRMDFLLILGGIFVGCIFMILSKVTKEGIGYGDSFVILILGIYLGFYDLLLILSMTFFLLLCVSIPTLYMRKMSRTYTLPFLPFLAGGYICFWLMGGVNC